MAATRRLSTGAGADASAVTFSVRARTIAGAVTRAAAAALEARGASTFARALEVWSTASPLALTRARSLDIRATCPLASTLAFKAGRRDVAGTATGAVALHDNVSTLASRANVTTSIHLTRAFTFGLRVEISPTVEIDGCLDLSTVFDGCIDPCFEDPARLRRSGFARVFTKILVDRVADGKKLSFGFCGALAQCRGRFGIGSERGLRPDFGVETAARCWCPGPVVR